MQQQSATFDKNVPASNGDLELVFNMPDEEIEPWLKCEPIFLVPNNADIIRAASASRKV